MGGLDHVCSCRSQQRGMCKVLQFHCESTLIRLCPYLVTSRIRSLGFFCLPRAGSVSATTNESRIDEGGSSSIPYSTPNQRSRIWCQVSAVHIANCALLLVLPPCLCFTVIQAALRIGCPRSGTSSRWMSHVFRERPSDCTARSFVQHLIQSWKTCCGARGLANEAYQHR